MLLEGETRQVLGFAVLVYLLPLVLFFVGYGVGAGMKLGGGLSALIGGVLFIGGILAAMWYSHKLKLRNEAPFAITERLLMRNRVRAKPWFRDRQFNFL